MDVERRGRRATSLLSRGRPSEPPAATEPAPPPSETVDVTPAPGPPAASPAQRTTAGGPALPARRGGSRPRRRPPSRRRGWAAAAVTVLLLAVAGGLATWGALQLDHARQAQRLADLGLAIAADPAAKHSTATVASGGSVTMMVSGDRAALVVRDLLMLDAQHTYQVWLVRGDTVTPVGLGPPGGAAGGPWVRVITAVQPGDTVAVSEEPAQGSTRPTGRPIAALKL